MSEKRAVYILGAKRTQFGKFFGVLKDFPAPLLAASAIKGVYKSLFLPPGFSRIGGLVLGQVFTAGGGHSTAKMAATFAGLRHEVVATLVNKVCASSLYALQVAGREIQTGEENLMLAGGMENMSKTPYLLERKIRNRTFKLTKSSKDSDFESEMNFETEDSAGRIVFDSMLSDGLRDSSLSKQMGELADMCAAHKLISREEQEDYALASFHRASDAQCRGIFEAQIESKTGDKDECIRTPDLSKMRRLPPVFPGENTVTAATSSQISDGAAILLLGDGIIAAKLGISPKIRLVDFVSHSQNPMWYTTAPVGAIQKLLKRNHLSVKDIDFFEINEAFAVVPIYAMRELGIPHEKLNVWGGAIAMGHPLGASGARIAINIRDQLIGTGGRYGIACACHAGGGAMAVLIENKEV